MARLRRTEKADIALRLSLGRFDDVWRDDYGQRYTASKPESPAEASIRIGSKHLYTSPMPGRLLGWWK